MVPPPVRHRAAARLWPRGLRRIGGSLLLGVVLLVLLVAGPAFAILVDFQSNLGREREAQAKVIAFQQVELINATMANLAEATRELMVAMSSQGALRRAEPACDRTLARIRVALPDYALLAAVRPDGTELCSASADPLPDGAVERMGEPFRHVQRFTVGRYARLGDAGRRILTFALPFDAADAAPGGILVAGLDLARLDALLADTPQRQGGTTIIRDRDGIVLARKPDSAGVVGETSDGPDRPMMGKAASGARVFHDKAGRERVLGYVPVALAPEGLFVSAGFDVDDLNSGIDRATRRGYGLIAVAAGCSLLFALLFGNWYLRAPAAVLLSTARRLGGGDLAARAAMPPGAATAFTALGHAFNDMAATLQRQRTELQTLNEALELRVAERTRALLESNNRLQVEIAERELTEANLRQAQKLQAVGQLAGGIAHDFNNVLTVILGSLELLRKRIAGGGEAGAARLIDDATTSVERGSRLTARILAFSRKQPLLAVSVDVSEVIGGMAELLARTLGPAVRLQMKLEGGLWPVMLDPNQFEAAIVNLALNASAAMPQGGRMSVSAANVVVTEAADVPPGDYVRVAVADSGTGMSAETVSRAFEPFFTTKAPGSGSGLGLSQVHGMVRQSGGTVTIDSRPGGGTAVTMLLPRSMVAAGPDHGGLADAGLPALAAEQLVLLVDDDRPVREVTAAMLAENGYTVVTAADGPAALDLLEREGDRIALVVTDHAMPGMTGAQLLDAVRRRRPGLAVLLATGYADYPDLTGEALSLDQIVRKPFRARELLARMRMACTPGTGASDVP